MCTLGRWRGQPCDGSVNGNTGVTHPQLTHSHTSIPSFQYHSQKHCGWISHSLSSLIHYRRQVNNQEKKKAFILDLGYGSDLISCS